MARKQKTVVDKGDLVVMKNTEHELGSAQEHEWAYLCRDGVTRAYRFTPSMLHEAALMADKNKREAPKLRTAPWLLSWLYP